jgi:CheY-like chemotaxis protein
MIPVPQQQRILFRILLVEDKLELRETLQILIESTFPASAVYEVGTVQDALGALKTGPGFALGILDIKVPARAGLQPEADPRIAERLRELGVPSVCITGFRESEDVRQYLQDRSLVDPPVAVIPKRVTDDWVDQLLDELRCWFVRKASRHVTSALDSSLGPNSGTTGTRSGTASLLSLQQEILEHWPYLDVEVRKHVRRMFLTTEEEDRLLSLELFSRNPQT